jgi:hypothetical protein
MTQGLPPQGPQFQQGELDGVYNDLIAPVFHGSTEEVILWLLNRPPGRYYARSGKTGTLMTEHEYLALYT